MSRPRRQRRGAAGGRWSRAAFSKVKTSVKGTILFVDVIKSIGWNARNTRLLGLQTACQQWASWPAEARAKLFALMIGLITYLIYSPVGTFDFVNFDDPGYVYENPRVSTGLTRENVRWAFAELHANISYWHPLTWISHQCDCTLFGLRAGAHHLTNVWFHSLNAALLFLIVWQIRRSLSVAFMAAALFAWHPLNIESVAWVAERKAVLSGCFWLATVLAYLVYVKQPSLGRYGLVLGLFICGAMSKPIVVALPLIMLLLDGWIFHRFSQHQANQPQWYRSVVLRKTGSLSNILSASWLWLVLEKVPFFLVSVGAGIVAICAQNQVRTLMPLNELGFAERIANALVGWWFYLVKLVWPSNLAVLYPHPLHWPLSVVMFSAAIFVLITLACLWERKRRPYVLAGWLWYVITTLPVIGLIQVGGQAIADRYAYLPVVGIIVAGAWWGEELCHWGRHWAVMLSVVAVITLGMLAFATRRHLPVWQNSITLFTHALRVTPLNPLAHNNLGCALLVEKKYEQALWHFRKTLAVAPDDKYALEDAGLAERLLGRPMAALVYYVRLAQVENRAIKPLILMGGAYLEAGDSATATKYFRQALAREPRSYSAHFNLARIYATHPQPALREPQQALNHAKAALASSNDSDAFAFSILAAAQAHLGEWKEALEAVQKAIDLAAAKQNWKQERQFRSQKTLFASRQPYVDNRLLTNNLPLE